MDRKHLVDSKWTALQPIDRDKHFMVTRLLQASGVEGEVPLVELQAILSKRRVRVPRSELSDETRWKPGWT